MSLQTAAFKRVPYSLNLVLTAGSISFMNLKPTVLGQTLSGLAHWDTWGLSCKKDTVTCSFAN